MAHGPVVMEPLWCSDTPDRYDVLIKHHAMLRVSRWNAGWSSGLASLATSASLEEEGCVSWIQLPVLKPTSPSCLKNKEAYITGRPP